ncbi:hypothetical protein BpOF4_06090 [Alkalihalophilus pseudofirmus OF4]|uniref:GH26 domain-containing protein n=1 Tax=Alkalihalophilus pseudofirmus (strain ATCC BAA-2126 / JCM 17055 / OF4) TaxID=398511 RepID=D3FZN8_ALKPO|nr:stalk domain-containing protein [Alkalihalophilus pseudofirmus]ADC49280.1 hypothetical protein BpOF4_06090 [Alkalihalophilus pseudofirmus OF4]
MLKKLLAVMLICSAIAFTLPETAEANDWKHYVRGVELLEQGRVKEAITELNRAASISPKGSTYRKLAEAYELDKQYQKAADTYYLEAETHRKRGDVNTYLAVKRLADALNTEIDLFVEQKGQRAQGTLGKYEPANGMYIGAYLEQDQIRNQPGNTYRNFNQLTGKQHAVYFTYHHYGREFPHNFARQVKEAGGAIQLALEPRTGLNQVKDDAYLRKFARDAKAAGVPIFLRYASEMNGGWVPWNGNPDLYKEKFRTVAKVMKEEAPNVAMVWAPSATPEAYIDQYYPGDAYVDWVGINLYSVPYLNGDPNRPTDQLNPLDKVEPIYNTYANRKPIMIAETASSHYTSVDQKDKTHFAETKMKMLYDGLKMKYPRVKAVHWFSVDTISAQNIPIDRRSNNYSLTVNDRFLASYKGMIQDPYYLSKVVNGPMAAEDTPDAPVISELEGMNLRQSVKGLGFAKTYDPNISKVVYRLNGATIGQPTQYPFSFNLNYNQLKAGTNQLEAIVFDSKDNVAARKIFTFTKASPVSSIQPNRLVMFLGDEHAYIHDGIMKLLESPFTTGGRTQVPLRFISENLGANVQWDQSSRTVTITKGKTTIRLVIDSTRVTVNGTAKTIDQAPIVRQGTTFVPLRFVTEEQGAEIKYTPGDYRIDITY